MAVQESTSRIKQDDPRWEVTERIIRSQCFAKSVRLSSFLKYVCELAREGREEEINEQNIGAAIFGREPGFDPGIDSIVRSHATRLRHRLERFYLEEGAGEEWRVTIPKGSYIPLFEPLHPAREPMATDDIPKQEILPDLTNSSVPMPGQTRLVRLLSWSLVACMVLLAALITYIVRNESTLRVMAHAQSESERIFWSKFFNRNSHTMIINADSGVVMLQGLTKQRVDLPSYLSGSYLKPNPSWKTRDPELLDLGTRRYTSVVDLRINQKLFQMTELPLENTISVYSRDIRPDEIKSANLILLGTYESTPWVQLFEPSMNFYFKNDLPRGLFSVYNRNPQGDEKLFYASDNSDPEKVVYGVVAYRPSLNGKNKVLVLEGQSMAGTETASDFIFDDAYLLPFLHKIQRADGSIPYFELLLRSKSMRGEASRLEIVAYRIEDQ